MTDKPSRRLTRTQQNYLRAMDERGTLKQGWGGYRSTVVVRLLAERGLAMVRWWPNGSRADTWEASATRAGKAALSARKPSLRTEEERDQS